MKDEILNFSHASSFNQVHMAKVAAEILSLCEGRSYEDIMDRLSAPIPPKEVLDKLDSLHNEIHIDHDKVFILMEALSPKKHDKH